MRIFRVSLLVLFVLLVIAFFTNPAREKHSHVVRETMKRSMSKVLVQHGIKQDNTLYQAFTQSLFEDMVWTVFENNIEYKNYYIFSYSQVVYQGRMYPITYGLYTYVDVMPQLEKEIESRINQYIKDNGGIKEILGF